MKRKRLWSILTAVTVFLFAILYIHSNYFFNPLTFKKDNITYLTFTWYKKPMSYSYINFANKDIKSENLENDKDIKFIYSELKKSTIIGPIQLNNNSEPYKQLAGDLTINSTKAGGCMVTNLQWFGKDSDVCQVSGMYLINNQKTTTKLVIKMTSDLKNFLASKFGE